jgi:ABC-type nitrate/sulfonate/bicarbonate transport system permease component
MTIVTNPADSSLPGVQLYHVIAARAGEWAFKLVQPLLATAAILGIWEVAVRATDFDPIKLPAPSLIGRTAFDLFALLLAQAGPTFWAAVGGIAAAAALGIFLGTLLSYSKIVMEAIYPTIIFFQLIPKVALAPVFLLWFGKEIESTILFSVFIAFFPVLVATISGLASTDPTFERMGRSLMASRLQIFLRVKFSFALPFIFSGLRIGVTFGIIGVILGEFMTAERGLGYVIMFAASNFETALLLAAILFLLFVGIALFAILLAIEWLVMSVYKIQ